MSCRERKLARPAVNHEERRAEILAMTTACALVTPLQPAKSAMPPPSTVTLLDQESEPKESEKLSGIRGRARQRCTCRSWAPFPSATRGDQMNIAKTVPTVSGREPDVAAFSAPSPGHPQGRSAPSYTPATQTGSFRRAWRAALEGEVWT